MALPEAPVGEPVLIAAISGQGIRWKLKQPASWESSLRLDHWLPVGFRAGYCSEVAMSRTVSLNGRILVGDGGHGRMSGILTIR